jgi:hypothetical protein
MESRQEQTEVQVEGRDEAMHEQKITLILLHKLAGRQAVTITADDLAAIAAEFAGSMPVLYARETDGNLTYQVIDARDVEAIEREVADGNARRIVEALADGAAPHVLKPGAAKEAIERAGGTWPGAKH